MGEATKATRINLFKAGLNPSDMDWDTYGVCQEEHFLLFSALRKTDNKLVIAAFDSLRNRQVIYDCSISIPKTTTQPHYDQQMEYNLRSVRPYIIRINDGFACAIGTTYKSEYNGNSFGNTYTYFFNGLDFDLPHDRGHFCWIECLVCQLLPTDISRPDPVYHNRWRNKGKK